MENQSISIYNEDCFDTMLRMDAQSVDLVITSPPYNTAPARDAIKTVTSFKNYSTRYDVFFDTKTVDEYIQWTVDLFGLYDKVLRKDGCVCYNISYGNENPDLMWLAVSEIIKNTNFCVADSIVWKKKSALPNNATSNKLTRICEFVFVFCRKSEYSTFYSNKRPTSSNGSGMYYTGFYNFIETANNDGVKQSLNNATFSSDLVLRLLEYYARPDAVVYDSFMGIGTTAVAARRFGCSCVGSELSEAQCELARARIDGGLTSLKAPSRKKLF